MTVPRPQSVGLAVFVVGAAIGLGYFATTDYAPVALAAVVGVLMLGPLLRSARLRLLVVIAGALVAFQSEGDMIKGAYMALALLCVAQAIIRLDGRDEPEVRAFRPMLLLSPAVIVYIGATYPIATGYGTAPGDWFRDMLPYLLVAILPVVGLDAARDVSYRTLRKMAGWLGVIAGVALAATWLSRRGATEETTGFLLASDVFVLFAFCLALVSTATARARWFWVTALLAVCLVATGSRSNLILLGAAVVGAIGSRRKGRVPLDRMIGLCVGLVVVAGGGVLLVGWLLAPDVLAERWELFQASLAGGVSADQSFVIREAAYDMARSVWEQNMWLGAGPGHLYVLPGFAAMDPTFTLDTPWMTPAKFGIVGTGLLLAYLLAIVRGIRHTGGQPHPFYTVGRAFLVVLIVRIPFSPWLEDKGVALALTLLVAMAVAVGREQRLDRAANLEVASRADDADVQVSPPVRGVTQR